MLPWLHWGDIPEPLPIATLGHQLPFIGYGGDIKLGTGKPDLHEGADRNALHFNLSL